ncbi:MAG: MFS transporter, partial [Gemmatimonadaceae bacterium]
MLEDSDPRRWKQLALLSAAELLGMSLWFAGSAVAPQLVERWQLGGAEAGWLTAIVQLGFVCGTALSAVLNLADIVPSRRLFAVSVIIGAIANAAITVAPSYEATLALRFITGFCLSGVYPPAMKMVATWFQRQRGLAIGTIVGALTVGKATPYLVNAFPGVSTSTVLVVASVGAVISGLLVAVGYRDGPFLFSSRPFSWGLV